MAQFSYYNPVRIEFGAGKLKSLSRCVDERRVLLVTSQGFIKRGIVEQLKQQPIKIVDIVASIQPNPSFQALKGIYQAVWSRDFDLIVALGGGSVLDSAKVLSVYDSSKDFAFVDDLIRNRPENSRYLLKPMIAIPTTSGTGSEVTPWGTVWDTDIKKKFSIHLPDLWPELCICDPELALTVPRDITVQTALDALSHCLESIWNRNANLISTRYAIDAAQLILKTLPHLVNRLDDLALRSDMMFAALKAGLAFSNTQTALAHAMSYYLTARKGIPHGIACSFSLPDIIDIIKGQDSRVDSALTEIFGTLSSQALRELYSEIGVSTSLADYGINKDELEELKSSLVNNQRMKNSIVDPQNFFETAVSFA